VSSILSAAWGADIPIAPIWLIRQAGRYLGHGVLPATPPDAVARLVDTVHRFSRAAALAEASTQDRSEERSFQAERSPGSPRE